MKNAGTTVKIPGLTMNPSSTVLSFFENSIFRRWHLCIPLLMLCFAAGVCAAEMHPSLPAVGSLDGLGINIHFRDPKPGEMEMLSQVGFKWVRMDFSWKVTEQEKGSYDFSAYDRLAAALQKYNMRAVFILAYNNKLYEEGVSPQSEETREAFAKWAVAAVQHFAGRGYIWEMWNEPNGGFWKPQGNADGYIALAKTTAKALREAGLTQPSGTGGEAFVGPATAAANGGIDLRYLEACFKAGLLEDWCGVTVHPYRRIAPESVEEDYRKLRMLIRSYAPKGKTIPVIGGEWGYSTVWKGVDEETQAKYLAREWLINVANDIPLSIWYDWSDDGVKPIDQEHHFGIVGHEYYQDRDPVYDPKPAYYVAKSVIEQMSGMKFSKRLDLGSPDVYSLLFTKGSEMKVVCWTQSGNEAEVRLPVSPGVLSVRDYYGKELPDVVVKEGEKPVVKIGGGPTYFTPQEPNEILQLAAAWDRMPLEIIVKPGERNVFSYAIVNPLNHAIKIDQPEHLKLAPGKQTSVTARYGGSRQERTPVRFKLNVRGACNLNQTSVLASTEPLHMVPLPMSGDVLPVRLENPSGNAFDGRLELSHPDSSEAREFAPIGLSPKQVPFSFAHGQKEQIVTIPMGAIPPLASCGQVTVYEKGRGNRNVCEMFQIQFLDAPGKNWASESTKDYVVREDGDAKVSSKSDLSSVSAPEGLPVPGVSVLSLKYAFGAGWKFLKLVPASGKPNLVSGVPVSVGWWIFGDGKGCVPRIRFVDQRGQVFQASGPEIKWTGWRYITVPIRSTNAVEAGALLNSLSDVAHWGGPNDGVIAPPIQWKSIFLLDNVSRKALEGEVYLITPTLIY